LLTATSRSFPVTVVDALGRKVVVPHRPLRIISLAPCVTEILFAIGAGNQVIANTSYCNYPPEAARREKIGGYLDPDVERVAALSPDLVLGARGNRREAIEQMQALRLTVITVDANNLEEVAQAIRLIGRVVGEENAAGKLAVELDARRKALLARTRHLAEARRPRTLFLFSFEGLFSAGAGSHIDELIRLAGGRNIAARTGAPWPQLSMEAIVSADPQVILLLSGHGAKTRLSAQAALGRLRVDPRWRTISAVKRGRLAVLEDDLITIPGPRLIEGLEATAAALHPELFCKRARL
jgi:iron complex transport system substrate-binding protein